MGLNRFPLNPKDLDTSTNQLVNDQVLWQSIKKGNQLAFSSLYRKYVNSLYNYGMHIQANHEDVKDTIQELFINIWSRRESMAEVIKVKYYIFKSFRNLYFQRINKEKNFTQKFEFPEFAELKVDSYEQELVDIQSKQVQSTRLQFAIGELTKRQKEAVILRFYNELSFQEVGSLMGISIDSVHNLLSKSIATLRESMKNFNSIFMLVVIFQPLFS